MHIQLWVHTLESTFKYRRYKIHSHFYLFLSRFFPFDQQTCNIEIGSWSYDETTMVLKLKENAAESTSYDTNTAWELVDFSARESNTTFGDSKMIFRTLIFHMEIRRYWRIHFFYMLIPILLIQLLALMQFLLPCDAAEKVGKHVWQKKCSYNFNLAVPFSSLRLWSS